MRRISRILSSGYPKKLLPLPSFSSHTNTISYNQLRRMNCGEANKVSFFLENKLKSFMGDKIPDESIMNRHGESRTLCNNQIKYLLHQSPIAYTTDYYSKKRIVSEDFKPDQMFIQSSIDTESFSLSSNESRIPNVGSIVEVYQAHENKIIYGVIVEPKKRKFGSEQSLLKVFTVDGTIEHVKSTDIRFHIHGFFKAGSIRSFSESEEHKNNIQFALISFIEYSLKVNAKLSGLFEVAYSKFAERFRISGVTLESLFQSFPHKSIPESVLKDQGILMSLHLQLTNDPTRWIAKNPNNIVSRFSPSLVNAIYFSNSIANNESITEFLDDSKDSNVDTYRGFLSDLLQDEQKEDLDLFLSILDTSNKHFIEAMKFYIIYPHPLIEKKLIQILQPFVSFVTPKSVYDLLVKAKIYNQNTDIYFSANALGESKLNKQSVQDFGEIKSHRDEYLPQEDNFSHIKKRKYYPDHKVYALPSNYLASLGLDQFSEIAVSLEKLNSRRYLLNVHIPDIATRLAPRSRTYTNMLNMKNSLVLSNSVNPLFTKSFMQKACFQSSKNENINCLTFSILYQPWEEDPWEDPEIKITFDRINSIRKLSHKEVNDVLNSRNDILPINIFEKRTDDLLSKEDRENLKFIYSITTSNFWNRSTNSGLNSSLHDSSILIVNDAEDNITDIQLKQEKSKDRSEFLIRELEYLIGNITSRFGTNVGLPLVYSSQEVITEYDNDAEKDDDLNSQEDDPVMVSPANSFLPSFSANSYDQLTIGKDANGENSPNAFICGLNFLSKESFSSIFKPHALLGYSDGFAEVSSILKSFNSIMNQYQLLYFYHQRHYKKISPMNYSRIRSQGYLEKPLSYEELDRQILQDISPSKILADTLHVSHKKYWVLRWLENDLKKKKENSYTSLHFPFLSQKTAIETDTHEDPHPEVQLCDQGNLIYVFKCIITENATPQCLGKAYCMELGIEVEIALSQNTAVSIGDRVMCSKILLLDSISRRIVLMI